MTPAEIDSIVKARSELISFYSTLAGGAAPTTAIVKQQDVAMVIGIAVRHLDTALKDHVNFGQRA